MGYNNTLYQKVQEKYSNKYKISKDKAAERTLELHEKIPALIEIDNKLRRAGLEVFSLAINAGDDFKEKFEAIKKNNLKLQKERAKLLKTSGYPVDYDDEKYECEICSDTGFVNGKMCSCMKRELTRLSIENSGIGNLIKTQTFENFSLDYFKDKKEDYNRMKVNLDTIKKYAEDFDDKKSGNLLFIGLTGLGKTHLSSAVAGKVIEKGFSVKYVSVIELISIFEHDKFHHEKDDEEIIEDFMTSDLLIIDDLGTELITPFSLSVVYNILNVRIANHRPMIINSNLSGKDLNTTYQDRILSRLIGEFTLIKFIGEDVRRKKIGK